VNAMWLFIYFIILTRGVTFLPSCENSEYRIPLQTDCEPTNTHHFFPATKQKSQPIEVLFKGSVEVFLIFNVSNVVVWINDVPCRLGKCNVSEFENTDRLLYARFLSEDIKIAIEDHDFGAVQMHTRVDDCFFYECLSCASYSNCGSSESPKCDGSEDVICDGESENWWESTGFVILLTGLGIGLLCMCFIIHYIVFPISEGDVEDDPKLMDQPDVVKDEIWSPVDAISVKSGVRFDFECEEKDLSKSAVEIETTGKEQSKNETEAVEGNEIKEENSEKEISTEEVPRRSMSCSEERASFSNLMRADSLDFD